MVASEVPLNDIINNHDATCRIAKWAVELLLFDIIYKPRWAIKSQVLADFVTGWTEAKLPKEYGAYSNWIMDFDSSKMLAGLGAGVVLTSLLGNVAEIQNFLRNTKIYLWRDQQRVERECIYIPL